VNWSDFFSQASKKSVVFRERSKAIFKRTYHRKARWKAHMIAWFTFELKGIFECGYLSIL